MNRFPEHAKVGRIVAKENFYQKIDHSAKLLFQHEIARITWAYKLAPDTINLPAKTWPEVEIFQIDLKGYQLSPKVLKTIDSCIPYPILFLLCKSEKVKAGISYKEVSPKNQSRIKVDTYFETAWDDPRLATIRIEGLDLDMVYENFIRQIAGEQLPGGTIDAGAHFANARTPNYAVNISHQSVDAEVSDHENACASEKSRYKTVEQNSVNIKTDIEAMKARERIQKQIDALDRRIRSEPSIGKKQKLAEEKYQLLQLMQK